MADQPLDTQTILEKLKRRRDELKLQFELGKMESHEEWENMEKKWHEFARKADLEKSARGVNTALSLLGEELEAGYKRLKKGF